jgi:hypothetical protein
MILVVYVVFFMNKWTKNGLLLDLNPSLQDISYDNKIMAYKTLPSFKTQDVVMWCLVSGIIYHRGSDK